MFFHGYLLPPGMYVLQVELTGLGDSPPNSPDFYLQKLGKKPYNYGEISHNGGRNIWGFPKIGVPLNHPLKWGVP